MSEIRNIEYFEGLLKADPDLPRPRPLTPLTNFEAVDEYKSAMRHYDWARLNLGLVTRERLQEEVSPIKFENWGKIEILWEKMEKNAARPNKKIHA
jgi:hypothetical protein